MSYQTTDHQGVTQLLPDHSQMVEVIDSMYSDNDEDEPFNEVIMSHDSGYSICLYPNGNATLEQSGQEKILILKSLSRDDQIMLWLQLSRGNTKGLLALDWEALD